MLSGKRADPQAPAVRGLLLVAALGPDRARVSNARRAVTLHFRDWDCRAYAHAVLDEPLAHCTLVVRPGWRWASLLNLTGAGDGYTHVFVLLDDIELPPATFSLARLLRTMHHHELGVASPLVLGAEHPEMLPSPQPQPGACVRRVSVVEAFATCFTRRAWACYVSMFADEVLRDATRAVGYGYDFCFGTVCAAHRQGVLVDQRAVHGEQPLRGHAPPGRRLRIAGGSDQRLGTRQFARLRGWVRSRFEGESCHITDRPPPSVECAPESAPTQPARSEAVATAARAARAARAAATKAATPLAGAPTALDAAMRDGHVCAGRLRHESCSSLGWADHVDETQKRRVVVFIAYNGGLCSSWIESPCPRS